MPDFCIYVYIYIYICIWICIYRFDPFPLCDSYHHGVGFATWTQNLPYTTSLARERKKKTERTKKRKAYQRPLVWYIPTRSWSFHAYHTPIWRYFHFLLLSYYQHRQAVLVCDGCFLLLSFLFWLFLSGGDPNWSKLHPYGCVLNFCVILCYPGFRICLGACFVFLFLRNLCLYIMWIHLLH